MGEGRRRRRRRWGEEGQRKDSLSGILIASDRAIISWHFNFPRINFYPRSEFHHGTQTPKRDDAREEGMGWDGVEGVGREKFAGGGKKAARPETEKVETKLNPPDYRP